MSEVHQIGDHGDLAHLESLPTSLGARAVAALIDEATLAPKPGLVDPRGQCAHDDMDLGTLLASAHALRSSFVVLAEISEGRSPDIRLRAEVGAVGRRGEQQMLRAAGGANTHRGALWTIGLLVCGAVNAAGVDQILDYGARLARLPDLALPVGAADSHGARARRRYGVGGAQGEAQNGFPHLRRALYVLRDVHDRGRSVTEARLTALVGLIAELDDTCLLHRGGAAGLAVMQQGARRVLSEGGLASAGGRAAFSDLDRVARRRGLSPGGSGDLLAAGIFLNAVTATEPTGQPLFAITEAR